MMRITEVRRGDGPEISDRFRRGDSWVALDGKHAKCKSRQTVMGIAVRASGDEGVFLRCTGCLLSYVLEMD